MSYVAEDVAAMLALVAEAEREPAWTLYTRYLRERERGLRKAALAHLSSFLNQAERWSEAERQAFARWPCGWLERHPYRLHHATPHPLVVRLLQPTLEAWTATDPRDPLPHRWLGMFFGYNYSRPEVAK